jgi:hypothetical protein
MPRVATLSLRDHAGGDLLTDLVRALFTSPLPSFVSGDDRALEEDDLELEPFIDWDQVRVDGRGFFSSDRHECASRRVDLRGPTDLDPGPLPMEEGSSEESAQRLVFETTQYLPD